MNIVTSTATEADQQSNNGSSSCEGTTTSRTKENEVETGPESVEIVHGSTEGGTIHLICLPNLNLSHSEKTISIFLLKYLV